MDTKTLEQSGVDLSNPDALDNWLFDNVWDADTEVGDSRELVGDSETASPTV